MGPCIIMLKHEVMVVDDWNEYGPQDLVTEALCIQIAIHKRQLCLLSAAYACPYHNPTATISKPARPHNTIYSVCHLSGTVETVIHLGRAHFSSVPMAIEGEHLPTDVGYAA